MSDPRLEKAFFQARENPNYTTIALPPLDVNKALADHYENKGAFRMTTDLLWEMETLKAKDPGSFIPGTVKRGSASSWQPRGKSNSDTFWRVSDQRLWLDLNSYGTVIEEVNLNHRSKEATFIGRKNGASPSGEKHIAGDRQPIFHVKHGVSGTYEQPLNTWEIVFETSEQDPSLLRVFEERSLTAELPEYIEIFIRDVLGVQIKRRLVNGQKK